jgi:hypothetical protein
MIVTLLQFWPQKDNIQNDIKENDTQLNDPWLNVIQQNYPPHKTLRQYL